MEKDNLQQKIMEMDETIELLVRSNQSDSTLRMVKHTHDMPIHSSVNFVSKF
jgi:kinesin family member 15